MSELWKPVCGYESLYEVSNEGRVRSKGRFVKSNGNGSYWKDGRILKPQKRQHGYLSVWLYDGESKRQVSVHRLVAEVFCAREDWQTEINHLNEDKQDNRAINLAWCTRSENCRYGDRISVISRKNTNGKRSRPIKQYTLSGEFVKEYPSMHEARRQTGFAEANIHRAIHGKYSNAYGYKWEYA